jgi:hypothetical protein
MKYFGFLGMFVFSTKPQRRLLIIALEHINSDVKNNARERYISGLAVGEILEEWATPT